ncbi:MAG: YncE family protein [Candidatus Methylomirabilis sp.]
MRRRTLWLIGSLMIVGLLPSMLHAEILAMLNYESKREQTIRREGIAIIDVDPKSEQFGQIVVDIPLPPDLVAHHIFYNQDASKAYVTALGQSILYVMDMKKFPYRMKKVPVPECTVGEDVVFSGDKKTWYLTCMGSQNVIVGDATADRPIKAISLPGTHPHGIAIHDGIDRILVPSTVHPPDLGDPGETVTVIEASTGKVLSSHTVSNKPSPSGEAPVEILFVPGSNPPVAYITNMFGGALWAAVWAPAKKAFEFSQAFDFTPIGSGVPLEMYFNKKGNRLYVTTAKPGHFHIFDISQDPRHPKLVKTIPAAAGAHHVAFTLDERYAFVQNSLLNLPGMSDGSITVIDLVKGEVVASVDTLKNQGFNPNCIVLLPEWNYPAGH